MINLSIIRSFDAEEMGKFLASIAMQTQKWYNASDNKQWLLEESTDGLLHKGYMTWRNQQWEYDQQLYPHTDNWVLGHMNDILEAILATGDITGYNVQVVIPCLEYGHHFDDYKDRIYYKAINFNVWSDFFDLHVDDLSDYEADKVTKEYLSTYKIMNFMINYCDLVNSIKVYYKNK